MFDEDAAGDVMAVKAKYAEKITARTGGTSRRSGTYLKEWSTKTFFKAAAGNALDRADIKRSAEGIAELYVRARKLYDASSQCRLCGCRMTTYRICREELPSGRRLHKNRWSNASFDAIVPRSSGKANPYGESNLQLLCVACNFLKSDGSLTVAKERLAILRTISTTTDNAAGILTTPMPPPPQQVNPKVALKLADKWHSDLQARIAKSAKRVAESAERREKTGTASQQELEAIFAAQLVSPTSLRCAASGGIFPKEEASLDRTDSTRGYDADNLRAVHFALNLLKNEWPTDEPAADSSVGRAGPISRGSTYVPLTLCRPHHGSHRRLPESICHSKWPALTSSCGGQTLYRRFSFSDGPLSHPTFHSLCRLMP